MYKYNVGLKTLLQEGLSLSEFYYNLVYTVFNCVLQAHIYSQKAFSKNQMHVIGKSTKVRIEVVKIIAHKKLVTHAIGCYKRDIDQSL